MVVFSQQSKSNKGLIVQIQKVIQIMNAKAVTPIIKNYELIQLVGQGQFGKVYRAKRVFNKSFQQQNTQDYALKIIPKQKVRQHPKLKRLITNQIEVLHQLTNHPNIVRFRQMFICDQQLIGMIYQYCDLGTLEDRIPLTQPSTITVLKGLVQSLLFAQSRSILHRDIKPANILFKSHKNTEIVKLADWGFSKFVLPDQTTQSFIGSPVYMAPEVLQGKSYDSKADIWSLGVVIYECIFGKCPWEGVSKVQSLRLAIQTRKIKFPSKTPITQQLKCIIIGMLHIDPNKRFSLSKIKSMLQQIETKSFYNKKEECKMVSITSCDSQLTQRKTKTLRDERDKNNNKKLQQNLCLRTNLKFMIQLFTKVKNIVVSNTFRYCLADLIYNDYIFQLSSQQNSSLNPERHSQNQDKKYFQMQISIKNQLSPCMKKNKSEIRCINGVQLFKFDKSNKTSKKDVKHRIFANQDIFQASANRKNDKKAFQLIKQIRNYYLNKLKQNPYQQIESQCLLSDSVKKKNAKIIIKHIMKVLEEILTLFRAKQQNTPRNLQSKKQISLLETDVSESSKKNKQMKKRDKISSQMAEYQTNGMSRLSRNRSASRVLLKNTQAQTLLATDRNKMKSASKLKTVKEIESQKKLKLKQTLVNLNVVLDIITYKQMPEQFQRFKSGQKYIQQLIGTSKGTLMKLLNHKLLFVHKKYCLD